MSDDRRDAAGGLGSATKNLPFALKLVHWTIILNFAFEVLYGGYMVFFVVTGGNSGPLGGAATSLPFETMVTRRLYASETWIAISGLAIYLGVTEILPRQLRSSP